MRTIVAIAMLAMLTTACSKKEPASPPGPAELRSGDKAADKAADDKAAVDKASADKAAMEEAAALAAGPTESAVDGATPTARDLLLVKGNVFGFSLEDSRQQFSAVTVRCGSESGGDMAKQQACLAEAQEAGAKEGFRFESAGEGKWTWISFGQDDKGAEEIFIKAMVALQQSQADRLVVKIAGEVSGKQWDAMPVKVRAAMLEVAIPILVVDADTVAMDSPRKGRLIYHLRK